MSDLTIGPELVGQQVCVPHRPEWGVGKVLRVQTTTVAGQPQHRVSIHFATGHRQLVVPPASLAPPQAEQQREAGWLDSIAGHTLDERLTQVPPAIRDLLGTPAQRIAALIPLYEWQNEPAVLVQWARRQANVADPLSHWSRDELALAFSQFCIERDSHFRMLAARIKDKHGTEALAEALAGLPEHVRDDMWAALRRPI